MIIILLLGLMFIDHQSVRLHYCLSTWLVTLVVSGDRAVDRDKVKASIFSIATLAQTPQRPELATLSGIHRPTSITLIGEV